MDQGKVNDGPVKSRKSKKKGTKSGSSTAAGKSGPDPEQQQRVAELQEKIRKRVACEERAHKIVGRLIENPITEQFLVQAAQFILPAHYADVVEERAIGKLCGYPICQNAVKNIPKQKFHISARQNKVFDITERKNFCSNQCYKASKVFERQISAIPVWAREKEPPVQFTFLPLDGSKEKGIIGEELISDPRLEHKKEVEALETDDSKSSRGSEQPEDTGVTTVNDLASQVSELLITDDQIRRGDEKDYVVAGALPESGTTRDVKDKKTTGVESEVIGLQDLTGQVCDLLCIDREDCADVKVTSEVKRSTELNESESVQSDFPNDTQGDDMSDQTGQSSGEGQSLQKMFPDQTLLEGNKTKTESGFSSSSDVSSRHPRETSIGEAEINTVVKTSISKENALKELRSSRAEPEEAIKQSDPSVIAYGTDTMAAVENTVNKKAQLLMELLDRRERLQKQLQKSDSYLRESAQVSASGPPTVATNTDESPTELTRPGQAITQATLDTEMIKKNIKIKSDSVIENIRRVASQHAALQVEKKKEIKKKVRSKTSRCTSAAVEVLTRALYEWKTDGTVTYLTSRNDEDDLEDKSEFERQYAALGQRVDALNMSDVLGEESMSDPIEKSGKLPGMAELFKDTEQLDLKVREYFRGNMRYPLVEDEEAKLIMAEGQSHTDESQESKDGPWEKPEEIHVDPILPLVHSHSQVAIRRKIVLDKLNTVLPDLLGPLRLTMGDVAPMVRPLVHTFNLTSQNISFKPAEWTLMGYLLLKILTVKSVALRRAMAQDASMYYFRAMILSIGLTDAHVTEVIRHMTSATNNTT